MNRHNIHIDNMIVSHFQKPNCDIQLQFVFLIAGEKQKQIEKLSRNASPSIEM